MTKISETQMLASCSPACLKYNNHLSLLFNVEQMIKRHLKPLHPWLGQGKALYNHEECILD